MFDLICVSNRALCRGDFLLRLARIAEQKPSAIILREKDLSPAAYLALARQAAAVCAAHAVPLILHSFTEQALALAAPALHLPLPLLRRTPPAALARFERLGCSVHSAAEAREAVRLGCHYLIAGHIFPTDCKRDQPGRGLTFLREVTAAAADAARRAGRTDRVPVWAIGGISPANIAELPAAGAAGACLMSSFMQCENPAAYFRRLRGALADEI